MEPSRAQQPPADSEGATVSQIASRFAGPSTAQPLEVFLSAAASDEERARAHAAQARALQHKYRGRGDALSEHLRQQRLEAMALRRAEQEARANLARYRGSHALALAHQRAKLGLALTNEQRAMLSAAQLQISFSAAEVEAEREKALEEAEAELAGYSEAPSAGGDTAAHALSAAPMPMPPLSALTAGLSGMQLGGGDMGGAEAGQGDGSGSGYHPLSTSGAAGGNPFASPLAARGVRPLPGPPGLGSGSGSGLQSEVVGQISAGGAAWPADEPAGTVQTPQPDVNVAVGAVDAQVSARDVEAAALLRLITSILQEAGRAMTLPELSTAIASRTGRRWGADMEPVHGPLLHFMRERGTPGYHILSWSKYVSLAGMPIPEPSPSREGESSGTKCSFDGVAAGVAVPSSICAKASSAIQRRVCHPFDPLSPVQRRRLLSAALPRPKHELAVASGMQAAALPPSPPLASLDRAALDSPSQLGLGLPVASAASGCPP